MEAKLNFNIMKKKSEFINEVRTAVYAEIESFKGAFKSTDGLLAHLQNYKWLFPQDCVEKYYGKNSRFFGIFDTQEHLNEFIKSMSVKQ